MDATRKLAQDVAMTAAPKGKLTPPQLPSIQRRFSPARPAPKKEGVEIGDTPDLKSVNAVNSKALRWPTTAAKSSSSISGPPGAPLHGRSRHMVRAQRKVFPQGVQIVGVSLDSDKQGMLTSQEQQLHLAAGFGGKAGNPRRHRMGRRQHPCTFVLNPEAKSSGAATRRRSNRDQDGPRQRSAARMKAKVATSPPPPTSAASPLPK